MSFFHFGDVYNATGGKFLKLGILGARERKPSERQIRVEALLPDYAARLSRKGMTVKKLYKEYHADHPDGYLKASFGMKLR